MEPSKRAGTHIVMRISSCWWWPRKSFTYCAHARKHVCGRACDARLWQRPLYYWCAKLVDIISVFRLFSLFFLGSIVLCWCGHGWCDLRTSTSCWAIEFAGHENVYHYVCARVVVPDPICCVRKVNVVRFLTSWIEGHHAENRIPYFRLDKDVYYVTETSAKNQDYCIIFVAFGHSVPYLCVYFFHSSIPFYSILTMIFGHSILSFISFIFACSLLLVAACVSVWTWAIKFFFFSYLFYFYVSIFQFSAFSISFTFRLASIIIIYCLYSSWLADTLAVDWAHVIENLVRVRVYGGQRVPHSAKNKWISRSGIMWSDFGPNGLRFAGGIFHPNCQNSHSCRRYWLAPAQICARFLPNSGAVNFRE